MAFNVVAYGFLAFNTCHTQCQMMKFIRSISSGIQAFLLEAIDVTMRIIEIFYDILCHFSFFVKFYEDIVLILST